MERGILKKAEKSKKMLIMVVAVLVFGAALYYAFFLAAAGSVDTTAATAAADSSFQQYKDYISNTKNGIKVLLEGEQLENISQHDLPDMQVGVERNTNPFMKTF